MIEWYLMKYDVQWGEDSSWAVSTSEARGFVAVSAWDQIDLSLVYGPNRETVIVFGIQSLDANK